MALLLPDVMPAELQQGVLDEFDVLDKFKSVQEAAHEGYVVDATELAMKWFMEQVHTVHSQTHNDTPSILTEHHLSGLNFNVDVHRDPAVKPQYKFATVVANEPHVGTLFFETSNVYELKGTPASELFRRDYETGLLIPTENLYSRTDGTSYFQAQNGQMALFETGVDLHSASPLSKGTKKVLFHYFVR